MKKKFSNEYVKYINSKKWEEKREQALSHYQNRCQRGEEIALYGFHPDCKGALQVHHIHYRTLGNERMEDLTVLCYKHHKKYHRAKDAKSMTDKLRKMLNDLT